jgi:hypothetical protein
LGPRKMWLLKRLGTLKRSQCFALMWDNEKGHLVNWQNPTHHKLKGILQLWEEFQGSLLTQSHLRKGFLTSSHLGSQRPLQPQSKGAWIYLEVVSDLGVIYMMVVLHTECKSYRAMEASTKISKEGLGGQVRVIPPSGNAWSSKGKRVLRVKEAREVLGS